MHLFRKFILIAFVFTFTFSAQSQTVFKTPSGEKYHLASCRMVKNVSAEITIDEAKKMGLQPCKICINYDFANNTIQSLL